MKWLLFAILNLCFIIPVSSNLHAGNKEAPIPPHRWKIAIHSQSFNHLTFFEAVDKAKEAGVKYIEAAPNQKLGGGLEGTTNYNMSKQIQKQVLKKLRKSGIKLISYGDITCNTNAEWEKLFQFAKSMGIKTIITEAQTEDIDLIDHLCNQYHIKAAIHNHPNPSSYWHPDKVIKALQNHTKMIGACCDNGHWMRSGIVPSDAYQKLGAYIISLHLKDMNGFDDMNAHTVSLGTGKFNFIETLRFLKLQKFDGIITLEFEYSRDNSFLEIKQSVETLKKILDSL
ncbi:MAG: sugar phosphate isomerase/epimerase [Bacteroidota bacterium]|nr:sugar phosphate isomerase/epimerase [Bacteroidota bacterium]